MGHKQYRVGRFPSSRLRFLSPTRGTEGVEKTIEGRFSKKVFPCRRDGEVEKLLSLTVRKKLLLATNASQKEL